MLDIRALLDGDKISLIKSEATWTSTIDNFPTLLSGWSKAKSCDAGGLDYKQYITSLLLFESGKTMAMRAMDTLSIYDPNQFCTLYLPDEFENERNGKNHKKINAF